MSDVAHWTDASEAWCEWARAKDHDAFWAYRSAFAQFVGRGDGQLLEIGCGEGRIARLCRELGYTVTAVEPVEPLLAAARAAESADAYALAFADALPFETGSFDTVVLYNVLMDVDALDAAVNEATRVLRPSGRMIVGIVHPLADLLLALRRTGEWRGQGSYFEARPLDEEVDRDGLQMRFRGWMRPLSTYADALTDAGLVITRLDEPRPDPDHVWSKDSRWIDLPLFLWLEACVHLGAKGRR